MDMSMSMTPTTSMSSAMASSTAMSGMSMGGASCKISMTWNWYTVGACFISKSWQVTSSGMFAGSCIGVICLVISLEFLRRVQREYDSWIRRQDMKAADSYARRHAPNGIPSSSEQERSHSKQPIVGWALNGMTALPTPHINRGTLFQRQFVRALIHMVQFGVAYFIMLLAMYYNGYIIICIIIGAFLGSFIFSWDQLLNEIK
ncbi:uncharacterized protein Z518_07972 [Rhinocladiella mackenziei CBS 650.93]|uniref:Copper transport protein n=1 Tax=Rhinocladiella mackenziei CBS 650.93 TaxID=1442369 RepID=A0A0D2GUV3_9EURO|nr:uncharacterized protein Z518_07972 [Rhinocladiella mackenziei CBS 650.93]KIX02033.1 hypothetical protein Z518_07972 [Rhinocladiella mackenziei CBS 650.93]